MNKQLTALALAALVGALAGCNTWQGAKEDAREVGGKVTNAVGTGMEKAGSGVEKAGNAVKKAVD